MRKTIDALSRYERRSSSIRADPLNRRAEALMRDLLPEVAVSDFCAAEFASAIGSRVRRRALELPLARTAFSEFDAWLLDRPRTIRMVSADLSAAASLMRRLDLPLKTGDAVHLAIAQRAASAIATFDRQMAASAAVLGVEVAGT